MRYEDFRELIKTAVEERMGNGYQVIINKILKNNSCTMYGLNIKEKATNISPTIYLEGFYDKYSDGYDLGDIADEIISIYSENKIDNSVELNKFMDFDNVVDNVVYRLINTERNLELLKNIPSVQYLDLSIIFVLYVCENASINITNEHMKLWNTSVDELYSAAKRNSHRILPARIESIRETISKSCNCEIDLPELSSIYVLSNEHSLYGASALLYCDILQTHFNNDLVIIPSSIHECLLLPAISRDYAEDIKQMIRDVNQEIKEQDFLSNNLYFYSCVNNTIIII